MNNNPTGHNHGPKPHATWEPTPEEIRAACLEIQSGWSRREEIIRRAPAFRPVLLDAEGHNYATDVYYSEGNYATMFGDE